MQSATEIYSQSIRQLPAAERLRLATLILEDLTEEQPFGEKQNLSALELSENREGDGVFQNPNEVDEYLKAERESWEN